MTDNFLYFPFRTTFSFCSLDIVQCKFNISSPVLVCSSTPHELNLMRCFALGQAKQKTNSHRISPSGRIDHKNPQQNSLSPSTIHRILPVANNTNFLSSLFFIHFYY